MTEIPRKKKKRNSKSKPPPSFESSLSALEKVVQDLEHGELELAEAIDCYEQGVEHLKLCYEQLAHAEQRVELLRRIDEDGTAITEAFDADATSITDRQASRSRRRASPEDGGANSQDTSTNGVDDLPGLF